jgi:hypothetical protein
MQGINSLLYNKVFTNTRANITVESLIREAQIVLISLTAQTVTRNFLDEILRQTKLISDFLNLSYGQSGQRTEVAYGIAISGRISNPVFREITIVRDSAVNGLRYCVEGGHANARRKINAGLSGNIKVAVLHGFVYTLNSVVDVTYISLDS